MVVGMSRPAWINVGGQDLEGNATVTAASNTLTITGHGLSDGDLVMVENLTGGADGPLIPGAVYFVRNVAGDDFQLSGTRGSQIKEFDTDGTADVLVAVPAYHSQALRLNDTVNLFHGGGDGLGAREGVRPGSGPVISVSGTTWMVHDHSGVVYPGITSISGPYRYHQIEESDSLDPADGSNDRIDALDLVIEDDDEDAGGFRRSRVLYVTSVPGTGEPIVTPNALRLGTILVPSGGSPSPSVQSQAPYTVSSGGVLPDRDGSDIGSGPYHGAVRYRQDTDTLEVWDGSQWAGLSSTEVYSYLAETTQSGNVLGYHTYTPTVSGDGGASFSTQTGRWKRIAPQTISFIMYFVVSGDGSGSNNVQFDAPTDITRSTRQTALVQISAASGTPGVRIAALSSFTGGSGATWDRVYWQDGSSTGGLTNLHGSDLVSGMLITCQGVYREDV